MLTGIHEKKIAEARAAWDAGPVEVKAHLNYSADEYLRACGTWADNYGAELLEAAEAGRDTVAEYAAKHGAP